MIVVSKAFLKLKLKFVKNRSSQSNIASQNKENQLKNTYKSKIN